MIIRIQNCFINQLFSVDNRLVNMSKGLLAFGLVLAFFSAQAQYVYEEPLRYGNFPDGFLWGVATAAYQVCMILY